MEKGFYKTFEECVQGEIRIRREFVSFTNEELLNQLRYEREKVCFSIINRGVLWYNTLTEEQRLELDRWYKEWLDVTDKYEEGIDIETIIPKKPEWLK